MESRNVIHTNAGKNIFTALHTLRAACKNVSEDLKIGRTKYYYAHIEENSIIHKDRTEADMQYRYEIQAHSEDGRTIAVAFTSSKNFDIGTTLRLRVDRARRNKINSISSLEEL